MTRTDHPEGLAQPSSGTRRLIRGLVWYFGLWQTLHVLVNLKALSKFHRGESTFPAFPPADGWSEETQATMEGMAMIDLVAAALTLVFVAEFERDGDHWPLLGAATLTISNYSAAIFAYPTRASGAWDQRPIAYWGLYLSYLPIVALTVLYVWWAINGNLSHQH